MIGYVLVSIASGMLFGLLDGFINANPLGRRLYAVYQPLARRVVDFRVGIVIDLAYGFVLAGCFLLLYQSLPGATGLVKGASFALLVWFLRTVMGVASAWMMFEIPPQVHLYTLLTGLGEMLILGIGYGLTLRPAG